ncbi:MAG TPA: hypothetical protein VN316_01465 [candidate division Zixibacteria bacterium]|nr:hypothetical protein [candidate division Zixibacteria bacterium]
MAGGFQCLVVYNGILAYITPVYDIVRNSYFAPLVFKNLVLALPFQGSLIADWTYGMSHHKKLLDILTVV